MAIIRIIIFNLLFYAFTFIIALACYVAAKVSTREVLQHIIQVWGRTVRAAIGVILRGRIEVRGLENLPSSGPRYVVAKHLSELDIIMVAALAPDASAVAMAELARYPFFGPILKKLGVVLVAVDGGPQGRTQQVIDGARRVIFDEQRPMLIYPEGELMKLGARERYKQGAGRIYEALQVPAIPVATSLGVIWPQRRWGKRVGKTAAIEFLPAIPPGLPIDRFMETVEEKIETATISLIREHAEGEELTAAERRYAGRLNNHGVVAAAQPPRHPSR